VAEFLEKELSEAQVTSLTSHLDFNAMRNNPATNRASTCILRGIDDYRVPGFLAVLWFGSTSTPSLPSSVSMIHLRHTGRQKKRDNQRDKRGVAPQLTVETEVNGDLKSTNEEVLPSLGLSFFTFKQKLVCLSRSLLLHKTTLSVRQTPNHLVYH